MLSYSPSTPTFRCLVVTLLGSSLTQAASINDTGVITCYSDTSTSGSACPRAGFTRQDADYRTNHNHNGFDFTAFDASGNATAPTTGNNPHPCVLDNVTGLTWEVKTNDNGLHDKDWYYAQWLGHTCSMPSGSGCQGGSNCDTYTYVNDVNAAGWCGYNDWRLPTIYELNTVVDFSKQTNTTSGNMLNTTFFPNTATATYAYWTGTTKVGASCASSGAWLWAVSAKSGGTSSTYNSSFGFIRLVRGPTLAVSSFVDNGDGTVTDQTFGLMWAKCSAGQTYSGGTCSGTATAMTWTTALTTANSSALAGYSDWKVPNITELQLLVDYTKTNPSINTSFFPTTSSLDYWSATPAYTNPVSKFAWSAKFDSGSIALNLYRDGTAGNAYTRLVRTLPTRNLIANRWTPVGLAYNPGVFNTVADTFDDDTNSYEVHKRNEATKSYATLNTSDQLTPGNGYWIKSTTNATLDSPGTTTTANTSGNCATSNANFPNGCLVIPLTHSGTGQYNLVSYPFTTPMAWSRIRFEMNGSLVNTTGTPNAAATANVASKIIWKYNGSSYNSYDDATPQMLGTLLPLEGFWVKTLSNANSTVKLLIPKP